MNSGHVNPRGLTPSIGFHALILSSDAFFYSDANSILQGRVVWSNTAVKRLLLAPRGDLSYLGHESYGFHL